MSKRVISHRDFVRDLDRGAVGEDVAEEFFKREYNVLLTNVSGSNRHWDFEVLDLVEDVKNQRKVVKDKLLKKFKKSFGTTIEVKYDEAAARYGNFFIELLFDIENDTAGAITTCKADLIVWVVPAKKGWYKLYLCKRAEFISWLIMYVLTNKDKVKLKVPGISPRARGIPIPIKDIKESYGFLGDFDFRI